MPLSRLAALALALLLPAGARAAAPWPLAVEPVATGLAAPLFATAPRGDDRLFVVERAGTIRIIEDGAPLPQAFLDITDRVGTGGEGGLLGLAFPRNFGAANRAFYVYYTDDALNSVVSRFAVDAPGADVANPAETVILTAAQPFGNHKGGTIQFGPDGFLYLGLGDGGSSNDPAERAQNKRELLGKMLRLDVGQPFRPSSIPVAGTGYAIPATNPFVGDPNARAEIWSLGWRNPYRWSFDRATGDLWIADVGQGAREEVDFEPAGHPGGRNYGWDVMEGFLCNPNDPAPSPPCNSPSLTLPVHQYSHKNGNCSITGGFVYRGALTPLAGLYFFGDYCTGRIWTYDTRDGSLENRTPELAPAAGQPFQLVGFGEDSAGELYVVLMNGQVHRIVSGEPQCSNGADDDGDRATDFPADPGCRAPDWMIEEPACDDDVDNDGDGRIDLADADCAGQPWWLSEEPGGCGAGGGAAGALVVPLALLGTRRLGGWRRHAAPARR